VLADWVAVLSEQDLVDAATIQTEADAIAEYL
jgi:hypothetical protein